MLPMPFSLFSTPTKASRWSGQGVPMTAAFVVLAVYSALLLENKPVFAADESPLQHRMSESEQSQLMYEIMIAELAGRRGYLDIATEGYRSASSRTMDPRISERATKLSIYSRNWPHALETGTRWKELDASNPEVYQILTQVQLRRGNAEAAADEMAALIEVSAEPVDATVESLYNTLVREPDGKTALTAITRLRDRFPDELSTNIAFARLAVGQSEREAALDAVNKALQLEPDNGEALMVRAQVLMSLGRGDEGLAELKQAVDRQAGEIDLHLALAQLLVDAERFDEAEIEFEEIYTRATDNPQAIFTIALLGLESKRNAASVRYFEQLLKLGEYESEAHFYLARIADSQQNYQQAIEHYEQVVEGESFFDARIRAAELYSSIGQLEEGRARISQLKEMSPDEVMPRLIRAEARMLREAGSGEQALQILSDGLDQYPNNSDLLYTRALMADGEGRHDIFKADLELLINEEPDNAHALNALGYYYADNDTHLDEAQELLEKANRLLPKDPAILDSLGWLYYRQGRMEEALHYLRSAYDELADPEIAGHLGEVLWVTGEQDSAREIWDKALAESPEDTKLKSVVERFIQ